MCAVVCVQAVSVRLCLYLARLLWGGGGTGSAAWRDWSPLTAWGPYGAQDWGQCTQTVHTHVNGPCYIFTYDILYMYKYLLIHWVQGVLLRGAPSHPFYVGLISLSHAPAYLISMSTQNHMWFWGSPIWGLLRFLGLRLRVWIPSFFIARGRGTCQDKGTKTKEEALVKQQRLSRLMRKTFLIRGGQDIYF